jgi:lipoprotein NlpI
VRHVIQSYHTTTYYETVLLLTRHHRYEIAGLKALARQKFAQELDLHLNDPDFPEACQEAYESTFHSDRGLRDVIVQAFRANPGLSLRPDVEMMVRETPGLAFELYRMAMGLPVSS